MSLLMDALKKAEQEKREAAKRLEEAREKGGLAAAPESAPPDDPDITAELETVTPSPPPLPVELSLEPRASITGPMERPGRTGESQQMETAAPAGATQVEPMLFAPSRAAEAKTPLEFIEEIGPEGMASFDQTFHGVAIQDGAVPGLFEETLPGSASDPGSRTYDQTLPGVPAAQLARDIGTADQPTPAAAQTVFTAGQARSSNALYKWGLPAGGIALLVAVGVFVHNAVTPVAPNTPSPWVARGIEAVPPPAEASMLAPARPSPGTSPAASTPATPVTGDAPAVAGTEPAAAPAVEPAPETAAAESAVTETPPVVAAEPAASEPPAATVAEKAPDAAPAPPASPSPIRISRKHATSEYDRIVREAYSSYQAGDYETAAIHYLAALNDRPDAVDALLGMGSVALKQRDHRRAFEYFSRVLTLDPKNQTATAALIALQRSADPTQSESALKYMLQESPDSPFLYFILGNVYASQSRWAEAQQAFFDAYRNDSTNPDYALNLASSLDRLGQSQPALDYYGVALKLAENQSAGFDAARVRARIQTLSSAGGQAP